MKNQKAGYKEYTIKEKIAYYSEKSAYYQMRESELREQLKNIQKHITKTNKRLGELADEKSKNKKASK